MAEEEFMEVEIAEFEVNDSRIDLYEIKRN